ncbi:hypothetical protein BaRGS_00003882 [Batillaria attramentaria]|uniref:Uncharacterized protein n=1 Tax=Batillaria attramentaria TaxID=370345 RepID=A0ABD0LZF6_9CAEN
MLGTLFLKETLAPETEEASEWISVLHYPSPGNTRLGSGRAPLVCKCQRLGRLKTLCAETLFNYAITMNAVSEVRDVPPSKPRPQLLFSEIRGTFGDRRPSENVLDNCPIWCGMLRAHF